MQTKSFHRTTTAAWLLGTVGSAQAHGGHGAHELWDMLTHAVGIEQGLALLGVVVGVLALRHWRARRDHNKPM
jgi:hypothetical protein